LFWYSLVIIVICTRKLSILFSILETLKNQEGTDVPIRRNGLRSIAAATYIWSQDTDLIFLNNNNNNNKSQRNFTNFMYRCRIYCQKKIQYVWVWVFLHHRWSLNHIPLLKPIFIKALDQQESLASCWNLDEKSMKVRH